VQTFGIFYDHLVHLVLIWYIFSGFGIMHQEKSGNPGLEDSKTFQWNNATLNQIIDGSEWFLEVKIATTRVTGLVCEKKSPNM
jgi:hypothetical protein